MQQRVNISFAAGCRQSGVPFEYKPFCTDRYGCVRMCTEEVTPKKHYSGAILQRRACFASEKRGECTKCTRPERRSKIAPWWQKKWNQLSESTRRAKPDEEPERSNATAQAISEVPAWNEVKATDKQVRIAYWRQPMSKAVIQDKNSGKIYFARCFCRVSEQFSRKSG